MLPSPLQRLTYFTSVGYIFHFAS
uniref:Uncharacterized protein n=1 Tax=Anguilla anguilla TaxID=7936 RepID=A0A0E9S8B5_ANGAN